MPNCTALRRPRLLEVISERWTRRVVAIAAGPGFGKTVLLGQVAEEQRLDPRGTELAVTCRDGDGSTTSTSIARLIERCPGEVCIVLDDVHHLEVGIGQRGLRRLIDAAPERAHFVLAGRTAVRGLGALRASGELLDVGEDDLALTTPELAELAALHRCDAARLALTGGWPAVASVAASCGTERALDHVADTMTEQLDDRMQGLLAVSVTLGPCDRALLEAAVGAGRVDDGDLDRLAELPLVARRDGRLHVHDVWRAPADRVLDDATRRAAVARAVAVLADQRDYERAHELCVASQLDDEAAAVVRASCRNGHPDVRPDVLLRWRDALAPSRWEEADGLLLRGLVGRVLDPFGPATAAVLERAVAVHRALGDVTGEVAAINELAFVLRNQGRSPEVTGLVLRAAELAAAGHPGVEGLLAMARSVCAELAGDVEGMLGALHSVPDVALSREWRAAFAFRRVIGHLTTGDERRMVRAATACAELADASTLRHALPMALWFAGQPQPALDALDEVIADAGRSHVDGVALGAFATMVLATSGRVADAVERLAVTEDLAAGCPSVVPMLRGYLDGIRALVAAADGDDDAARATLETALADRPLTGPVGWLAATRWLPLAYVLVPAARPIIDAADLGPLHATRVAAARLVVAARDGGPIDTCTVAASTAPVIATTVPLPWSMLAAARLVADGHSRGPELAAWCLVHSGAAARQALRAVAATAHDPAVRRHGRGLLGRIPLAPDPIRLEVLGPTMLRIGGGQQAGSDWQRERVRSLLLYLVLHGPARREAIADALWPGLDMTVADRNLRVTLAYLQRVVEPDREKGEASFVVRQQGPVLVLAGAPHVTLDVTEFEDLLGRAAEAERHGVPSEAHDLLRRAVDTWRGPCLVDVADADWAQPARDVLTGRYAAAAVRVAELSLAAGDGLVARDFARRALSADEWSEPAHQVLIGAALAEGDRAGAARAVAHCVDMLADLGVDPAPATSALIRRVQVRAVA